MNPIKSKMIVSIKPKWLMKLLSGNKKFEFRNWKVPQGTIIYFYCSQGVSSHILTKQAIYEFQKEWWVGYQGDKPTVDDFENVYYKQPDLRCTPLNPSMINGKVVATAVVRNVIDIFNDLFPNLNGCANIDWMYRQGFTDQKYALELEGIQEIKGKSITEFIKLKDSLPLTRPPQSRVWIK